MGDFVKKNTGKIIGTAVMPGIGTIGGHFYDQNQAARASQGGFDPYSGMPTYPGYVGMEPEALAVGRQVPVNTSALNKFSTEAMREGPGRGARLALADQSKDALQGKDAARALAATTAAEARSNMAMRGGLSKGASERAGRYATDVGMDAAQKASAVAAKNRANILIGDEANRVAALGQVPGMQLQASQFDLNRRTGDIERQSAELAKRNLYNLDAYKSQMAAWAGGKQADATQRGGKK